MQTLGEEYCDLVQVTSRESGGMQPHIVRRIVLMCSAILAPHLFRLLTSKLLIMSRPRFAPPSFHIRERLRQLDEGTRSTCCTRIDLTV